MEVVKPSLVERLNQSFPDPSQFKKEEEFVYAAKTASILKKVIVELLAYFEQHKAQAVHLRKKKDQVDPFKIGE